MTTDPTARDKVWAVRPVHKQTTRKNPNPIKDGPLPTIWEDGGMTTPTKALTSGEHRPWPTKRVNGERIGAKQNNVRHASLKRIEKLIKQQRITDSKKVAQQELSNRAARAQQRAKQKLEQAQREKCSKNRDNSKQRQMDHSTRQETTRQKRQPYHSVRMNTTRREQTKSQRHYKQKERRWSASR